ncbi:hypothetical protein RI367_000201 [Sorochytrium milnesiophthora]
MDVDNATDSATANVATTAAAATVAAPAPVTLYRLSNYSFAIKDAQPEEDTSVIARLDRLQSDYEQHGMRTTVEAAILVHEHNHPHVLMLQIANSFFKLPGDYLRPGEDERDGLKRRLNRQLSAVLGSDDQGGEVYDGADDWVVGECLGQWWRPNFETFFYPYIPAHISRPKECKKVFLVQIPPQRLLSIPRNMKLLAVPLFELYENSSRFGAQIAALPHLASRVHFQYE